MAITYDSMMNYAVPEVAQVLTDTDCILYALGVGFGAEPEHPGHLRYVYEDGLQVLPMMANVTAYPGFWLKHPVTGVDWKRVLHGEQVFTIHRPLPLGVKLIGRTRIVGIDDKGPAFGAFMFARRDVVEEATGSKRSARWSRPRCCAVTAAAEEATHGRDPSIGSRSASPISTTISRSPPRRRSSTASAATAIRCTWTRRWRRRRASNAPSSTVCARWATRGTR